MALLNIAEKLIVNLFESTCGKWQVKKPEAERRGFLMSFSTPIDHDRESGYRYADLLLYGDMNYVGVWSRTRWTVIPLEDLEDDGEGDTYVKDGKDYDEGASEWTLLVCHDSGWRSAVHNFLRDQPLQGISGLDAYKLVNPADYTLPNR
jgi:hypothetical protein